LAYTRWNESGHFIFGGEDCVDFDGTPVDNDAVDVFLYKLYEERGATDDEFWQRRAHGKRVIENFQHDFRVQKITKHMASLDAKAAAIAALPKEIWREHYTPIIGEAQAEYMLEEFQSAEQIIKDIRKNGYTYFTAKDAKNGELLGYCAVVPKDEALLLSKLYVHKDARGRGIARAFLDEVTALCRMEYGFDKICLTVNKRNESAIAAYQKMGFETVDSVKTDIGGGFYMDDYVMEFAATIRRNYEQESTHRYEQRCGQAAGLDRGSAATGKRGQGNCQNGNRR